MGRLSTHTSQAYMHMLCCMGTCVLYVKVKCIIHVKLTNYDGVQFPMHSYCGLDTFINVDGLLWISWSYLKVIITFVVFLYKGKRH